MVALKRLAAGLTLGLALGLISGMTLDMRALAAQAAVGFDSWAEAFTVDWMRLSAERAGSSQYFSGAEQAAFDRQLTPRTPAQRERRRALASAGLAQLARYRDAALTPEQRVSAGILRWSMQRTVEGAPFEDHGFVFDHRSGAHLSYGNFLTETHALRRPADVDAYLQRLAQVPARLDEAIARARAAAARGLLPPRFILERSQAQVDAFLKPAPADNLFVQALARRSQRVEGLEPEARQRAVEAAIATVADGIRPAYERVAALLRELHPRTTQDAGQWRLPDGAAAYAQDLASNTGTALRTEEIHAIGLREVARIEAEMDGVLKRLGRAEGSVETRMAALRTELQPPAEPDPRPMILARYAEAVRDAQRRSQLLFKLQPAAAVEVRREPALTERTASAHYSMPTPDGSRPGVFWAPLPGPDYDMLRIRSLAVHEAVPGHHFQLALQQEQRDLPRWRQRRVFGGGSAHSEGWALYAERLALDKGWYEGDPHALLGALDGQLFRARRLVVDTGLHVKRWTREQAIA